MITHFDIITQSNRKSSGGKAANEEEATIAAAGEMLSAPRSVPAAPPAASSSSSSAARGSTARETAAVAKAAKSAPESKKRAEPEPAPLSANDEVLQLEIRKRRAEVERYQLENDQIAKRYKAEEEHRALQNRLEVQRLEQTEKLTTAFVALTELLKVVTQKLDS
jgi:hypothetical protein